MNLADVKRGDKFKIVNIPDTLVKAKTLRFGISEGTTVECAEKIPGGPVIIKKNLQEIAIGRKLAKKITIDELTTKSAAYEAAIAR
ncbi:FeoA family protein [Senegalia massiliensis]|uniref:FeoA family protein n=1 Tax=Senegalia massiliensis TaxID=1720316 RepID=UPI0010322CB9|nr:ferrous iron transport protein A [Senegalia massiliensis]